MLSEVTRHMWPHLSGVSHPHVNGPLFKCFHLLLKNLHLYVGHVSENALYTYWIYHSNTNIPKLIDRIFEYLFEIGNKDTRLFIELSCYPMLIRV